MTSLSDFDIKFENSRSLQRSWITVEFGIFLNIKVCLFRLLLTLNWEIGHFLVEVSGPVYVNILSDSVLFYSMIKDTGSLLQKRILFLKLFGPSSLHLCLNSAGILFHDQLLFLNSGHDGLESWCPIHHMSWLFVYLQKTIDFQRLLFNLITEHFLAVFHDLVIHVPIFVIISIC